MINPTERQLHAMLALSSDADFKELLNWFEATLIQYKNDLVDNNTDRAAGAVSEIREIYNTIISAREYIDRLQGKSHS